jgi:four helix bundle protein
VKYSTFEELPVWKAAIELASRVFAFTRDADFRGFGDLKNQLERSTLSISNNIAEGFERGTTKELIAFLYISRGSAGEARSMLRLCEREAHFSNFKSEISDLIGRAVNISKQLHGWLESLKNSDIKGVRYLNQKERAKFEQAKDFEEFDREMEHFRIEFREKLERGEI